MEYPAMRIRRTGVVAVAAIVATLAACGRDAAIAAAAPSAITLAIEQPPLSVCAGATVLLTTVLANTTDHGIAVRRFPGLTTSTNLRIDDDTYVREIESRKMVGDQESVAHDLLTLGPHQSVQLPTRVDVSALATKSTTIEVTCTFESAPVSGGPEVWTGKAAATATLAVVPKE